MTSVTDVVSQLGGLADWRIGGGADSRNTERPHEKLVLRITWLQHFWHHLYKGEQAPQ